MCTGKTSIVIPKTSVGGRVMSDIRPGNFHVNFYREEARVAAGLYMYCKLPTYSRAARSPFLSQLFTQCVGAV